MHPHKRQHITIIRVVPLLFRIRMEPVKSVVRRIPIVYFLFRDSVRLMAGDESFSDYTTALDIINKGSIILEMGEQLPENPLAKRAYYSAL